MSEKSFRVEAEESGERLDRLISTRLAVSRSVAQRLSRSGAILVDGHAANPSHKARPGEKVFITLPDTELHAENIPIEVVYEDDHLLVVNKPANLVVHPGAGNPTGTLVNALLDYGVSGGDDPLRPGIVHRLDRDTSGLMMAAKGEPVYSALVALLKARSVTRVYRAIVEGTGLPETGTVDSPVGRDPGNPTLMAAGVGKSAITHFEVLQKATDHTMLRVKLETGRTHQIRAHMSAIGYPVHADPLYGTPVPGERLWLHAERLAFEHPATGETVSFEASIPEDLILPARLLGFERG